MFFIIFLIILSSTSVYNIYFINEAFTFDWINLLLSIVFIGIAFFRKADHKNQFKELKQFIWIYILAVFISSIVAFIDWKQGLLTSFIATRFLWWLAFGYFLIKMNVSSSQIYKALKLFAIGYIFLVILSFCSETLKKTLLSPEIIALEKGEFFWGLQFIILCFYIEFSKVIELKKAKGSTIIFLLFLFLTILLTKSRTTIFSVLLITFGTVLLTKKVKLVYKILLLSIAIPIVSILLIDNLNPLIDQTIRELSNPEYNRIKAIYYFLFEFNQHWYAYFLGNGFASSTVSFGQIVDDLKLNGIYQSDLGLLGQWSMFGLISIYALYRFFIIMVNDKKTSLYFKLVIFHVTIGFISFLIFRNDQTAFFLIFFYLYEISKKEKENTLPEAKQSTLEMDAINPIVNISN